MQLFRLVLHARVRHRHGYGTPPEEAERRALVLYLCSSILATCMGIFGKLCSEAGVHFFTIVAVRSSVMCLLIAPLLITHKVNPFALHDTMGLLLLRGVLGFASLSLWYLSVFLLPLSDANALSFVSPVMVALLAPLFLGEPTPRAVYVSLPVCIGGMLLVAQPTWLFGSAAGATSTLGIAAGVLQALFGAGSKITIRALNKHDEPLESILFSMGFVSTLGAAAGSWAMPGIQFAPPQRAVGWGCLAATSALALVVQALFTASLRKCNAAKAASLDYLSMLWTLLADGLVFHKLPNTLSMVGAGAITAASLAAILWCARHPGTAANAGGEGQGVEAEAPQPKPLQYKKEHYLGQKEARRQRSSGRCGSGTGVGGSSEGEGEAMSLLQAAAVCEGSDQDVGPHAADCMQGAQLPSAKKAADASTVAGACVSGRHAAKLALASTHTSESSKSWRLGTEIEGGTAAVPDGLHGGSTEERGSSAGGATVGDERGSGGTSAGLELQAVAAGPAATRTSTEKEQALAAAGK